MKFPSISRFFLHLRLICRYYPTAEGWTNNTRNREKLSSTIYRCIYLYGNDVRIFQHFVHGFYSWILYRVHFLFPVSILCFNNMPSGVFTPLSWAPDISTFIENYACIVYWVQSCRDFTIHVIKGWSKKGSFFELLSI